MNLSWVSAGFVILAWGVTFANTRALLRDFSALEIQLLRFALAWLALLAGEGRRRAEAGEEGAGPVLGGDEVREPLHAAGASGRALLQAAFVVRHAEEAPGTVHVDDGEGKAVREQAGRGQALLLPAFVMHLPQRG